ncbi:hypothetical protein [Paraburkholderia sacchari]|uniref:hypothetical protein n=1 Tax=Paraburkholderia sacchari TaxID=159450 RepID=UPI001BCD5A46|nr:hypothetical protein [Paraburkholderia sacchari]
MSPTDCMSASPCPFCGTDLTPASAAGYHEHPPASCILSGFEVSTDEVEQWNRRELADAFGVMVLLGARMYIDHSMQFRNGTLQLTIKRMPHDIRPALQ